MSDTVWSVNPSSWHARRYYASVGDVQVTNLCHYFWVVVKSLLASFVSGNPGKVVRRCATAIGMGIMTVVALGFFSLAALMFLSLVASPILALIATAGGSEITPGNTTPLIPVLQELVRDNFVPMTRSDASDTMFIGVVIDCLIVLVLSICVVSRYNKTHQAGFLRLSWERFKNWKNGTVVCPLIQFEAVEK